MTESAHEFLLLHEVARECRAPLASVRHWIATGRLRSIRPGRRRLVLREDLDRFLASGEADARVAPASAVEGG
jgi:excisionase family DNA binding protein